MVFFLILSFSFNRNCICCVFEILILCNPIGGIFRLCCGPTTNKSIIIKVTIKSWQSQGLFLVGKGEGYSYFNFTIIFEIVQVAWEVATYFLFAKIESVYCYKQFLRLDMLSELYVLKTTLSEQYLHNKYTTSRVVFFTIKHVTGIAIKTVQ